MHVYQMGVLQTRFHICLNPPPLTLITPFSLLLETRFKHMQETVIFIFKKYKQLLKKTKTKQKKQYPIIMDCILKSFMDTVTLMIVDFCGSFGPSVRGSLNLAEDHCERVETLHLRSMQML